ncbi:hypothetical protein PACTADRAFT_51961 [Pachysolen tannophilus NRRL Y-2460]|uniref:FIST domain-containing protein n=1 Tax=Pachysolen tannophilus NRRL Y-2460 TaxID=669874 RepID=A0A1E4TNS1_PACTA|nr:hypothetical protein PACTADRAFT_51961 [Pachysolen tannophilus NRRL Y-2460]
MKYIQVRFLGSLQKFIKSPSLSNVQKFSYSTCFKSRTTLNPIFFDILPPSDLNGEPKSLLLLSTPQHISMITSKSIGLQEKYPNLQIVTGSIDSIFPHNCRNGYSELWANEYFEILDSVRLHADSDADLDHITKKGLKNDNNWKLVNSMLNIQFNKNELVLNISNTIFYNNEPSTLFYFQGKQINDNSQKNSGYNLLSLKIKIPSSLFENINLDGKFEKINFSNFLKKLSFNDEELIITDCKYNLIKKINGKGAAIFLENNSDILACRKEVKVFAKIIDLSSKSQNLEHYQVLAGGGGSWSTKSAMLALSPDCAKYLKSGCKVEFYMVDNSSNEKIQKNSILKKDERRKGIYVECCSQETKFQNEDVVNGDEIVVKDCFSAGCEKGFKFNGINYTSSGELMHVET